MSNINKPTTTPRLTATPFTACKANGAFGEPKKQELPEGQIPTGVPLTIEQQNELLRREVAKGFAPVLGSN